MRPGQGHGHGGPGPGHGHRGRASRGDVRTAVLLVLAEEPMHGYQMMQTMNERSGGAWRPSPGAVYPTITQLEHEGLVSTREDGGRRLVTLTAAGRRHLQERDPRLGDPFVEFVAGAHGPDLRSAVDELQVAARQLGVSGTPEQAAAAARVLADARRALYLILAGEPGG